VSITFNASPGSLSSSTDLRSAEGPWLESLVVGEVLVTPIAYGMTPIEGRESAFAAYRALRELVYIQEAGIIDLREGEPATDFDSDDERSIHLAAVERTVTGGCVVGSMRLILRGNVAPEGLEGCGLQVSAAPLPVELEFSDVVPSASDLGDEAIACEISRYISRHESKRRQIAISGGLHQVSVATVTDLGIGPTYAIVERWLDRILRFSRVPLTQLSEPRWIERYGTPNYPVEIHMYDLAEKYGSVDSSVVLRPAKVRAS